MVYSFISSPPFLRPFKATPYRRPHLRNEPTLLSGILRIDLCSRPRALLLYRNADEHSAQKIGSTSYSDRNAAFVADLDRVNVKDHIDGATAVFSGGIR